MSTPTIRALQAMELLATRGVVPAAELAARLGVSGRATRRYVGILRDAGVAVESVRGPHGGYRLNRRTRLPPVVFTPTEALGLVMAVLDGRPAAALGGDPIGEALGKVIAALPDGVGRQAAALRTHAAAVPDRSGTDPDPTTTSVLVAAVADRVSVELTYRSESGPPRAVEVDPWAVVARHGRWYLLGRRVDVDSPRTYRIDRVLAVRRSGRPVVVPDDLDPVAALEEHLGRGWRYPTRVSFDAPLAEVARWARPPMGRLTATDTGCELVGTTRNPTMYAREWLAHCPVPFHVHDGPELRAAVVELAAWCFAAVTD